MKPFVATVGLGLGIFIAIGILAYATPEPQPQPPQEAPPENPTSPTARYQASIDAL